MNNEMLKLKKDYLFSRLVQDVIEHVLEDLKKIQLETGSKDKYGQGLYNGIEVSRLTLLNQEGAPKFLNHKFVINAGIVKEDLYLEKV